MKRKQKQFSQGQIQLLLKSPYVVQVYSNRMKYSDEFKQLAIDKYKQGFAPVQIFIDAGLNLELIGQKNSFNLIKKWLKNKPGLSLNLTLEEQVKELQAKNAYLEAELDFVKKAPSTGRVVSSGVKFFLIRQTLKKYPIFKVCLLCKIAKVSSSGYFAWVNRQNINRNKDTEILKLIAKIFYKHSRKIGFRRIKMELEKDYQMVVNHKKIIRIKKEYGLKTRVRTTNQHRASFEKVRKWCIAENILNRNFNQKLPEQAYATDVTYLILNNGLTCYLSAIKDLGPKEIAAHEVSESHDVELAINTLDKLERDKTKIAIMHSDRGGIYTSFQYIQKLKNMNLIRSMSRSGECLDNASIETFFGHLKDEVDYKNCKNIEELRDKIDKYVYYYNNGRYQWNLKRMAPKEYRHFLEKSYGSTPL